MEFILGGIFGAVILIYIEITQLRNEMKRTNNTLDRIAKQIGATEPILESIEEELIDLLKEGKKIKAVKRYREVTGCGLKESKEYIDTLDLSIRE
ncbi:ribosomal protein L7/L12 [Natronobacillus azotifigens]|uniref:Ribosomal protein L7/L12 n=1 Tax=Natronobacillus azotifigens TaxID=472978 RepID=A0A9J6RB97_9BACI|nr:ribosomal protein L7/L12 [Natronobacillus azotifigens]MCZ0702954.1 ribosomal protein L7/L12 [Natronobacillus azotifigens]